MACHLQEIIIKRLDLVNTNVYLLVTHWQVIQLQLHKCPYIFIPKQSNVATLKKF